ncbi:acyltransferase family protein [Novosphingobium sp. KACC 22771]|uniref:acyltransferase family protein n=1 Tax=Novosphingobium sp. KACC 22771 TaxID=3025670 RepID=UPI0023651670|nr:acyltransferase [Novosphingobium sp. KACC 22771]WDF75100.1 acyltransferase [Novosphingobium sp. KACC 22771]
MHKRDGSERLARLDGLRGLAAAGVVFYHMANWPDLPVHLDRVTGWVFREGWTLVDLFFVLSGYVFAHVYGAPGLLRQRGAMRTFAVARFARLWPLHGVTLCLFALFSWGGGNNASHFLAHALMLQGFDLDAARSFNSASWSLSIEILCYALFAAGAWFGERTLLWITVLAVVGCGWWLAVLGHPGGPWFGETIPRGIFGFFTGQMLWRNRAWGARLPIAALLVMVCAGLWLDNGRISPLVPLGMLTWTAAVLLALRMPVMESAAMHWLGQRSFGLYLVHMLFIHAIDAVWPPQNLHGPAFVLAQAAIVLGTLIAADAAYRWIEMPGRRVIRRAMGAASGGMDQQPITRLPQTATL